MRILSMLTLFLFACGDKDTDRSVDTTDTSDSADTSIDTNDTSDTSDSVDSIDSVDTQPQTTCQSPEFRNERAFYWKTPEQWGGFTAVSTESFAMIADVTNGFFYAVPWESETGYIEDVSTFNLSGFPMGFDKAMYTEGYLTITDAYASNVGGISTGAIYLYSEDTLSSLSGSLTLEESADIVIYAETAEAWGGSIVLWDATEDSLLDAIVTTGPFPGDIAVFSDFETYITEAETTESPKHIIWDQADFVIKSVCSSSSYAPNNIKIFGKGSGDGFLAVGCPQANYRTGEVLIYDLPLSEDSVPVTTLTNVTGWRMDSNGYGEPLYVEDKSSNLVAMINQGPGLSLNLDFVYPATEDPEWWGSCPTLTMITNSSDETCRYLVTGDQAYTYKGDELGAVYATLIGPDHLATEWAEMSIPSGETDQVMYLGAVNEFSPNGLNLMTTGWKSKGGTAGGMVLTTLVYE